VPEPAQILVVDDDRGTRETLRKVLQREGHAVGTADNGRVGLEFLLTHPTQVAIIGLELSDASGLDLLEAIHAASLGPEVILLAAPTSLSSAVEAANGGAFAYLTKPVEMRELLATLARALEKHRLAQTLREAAERYRLVSEHTTDAIFFCDLDDRVVFGNSRTAELTGYRATELVGTSVFSLLTPNGAAPAQGRLGADPEGPVSFETRLIRRGGDLIWVEVSLIPVRTDGRVVGRLGIARDITERKRAEQALLEANHALTARVVDLEHRNREMALLGEAGELLQRCHSTEEAYRAVKRLGQRLFAAESGMLAVLDASNTFAEVVVCWGGPAPGAPIFAPDQCWALRRGRPYVVDTPESSPLCEHLGPRALSAPYLCIPMRAQGAPIGILHLRLGPERDSSLGGPGTPAREVRRRLAFGMAERVAVALGNLRLQEMLRNQVTRDPVTGLFNRRYMTESLEREVHRAKRHRTPLGIVMLDVDHFKSFNDRYGHDAGDRLLRALGEFLRTHTRGQDVACRYGGDEFTLILPGASLDVTQRRAEQLRHEFNALRTRYPDAVLGVVTLSIGVATFPAQGGSWEVVLRAADAALYRAKHDGRDRVAAARDPETDRAAGALSGSVRRLPSEAERPGGWPRGRA
jgi:diguanylate cyclase (GGDEF)-like protein/PAS domain S-box-containing protein